MPLREALLAPIPGENPAGQDLRYTPLYDKLKEARREDEDLAQGEWKHERKLADHALVIKLCEEAIATQSKDLQLAVWLVEALLKKQGFAGFADGLLLCRDLLTAFWEHLYPAMEDGDLELRAAPLDLLGGRFDAPLKMTALNAAGHNWFQHRESRALGYDDASKDANARKAREKALKEGRLAPEEFDKSFEETPKAFYAGNEKALDAALAVVRELGPLCEEKFGGQAPTFGRLQSSLEEVRHLVHQLLDKKREAEPDPVEPEPVEAIPEEASPSEAGTEAGPITFQFTASLDSATEPPDRREAIESIVSAAALLRRREPRSPAAYLMLRGLRWGELRAAAERGNTAMLESPPSEARRLIKRLHVEKRWRELLEAAEAMMAFPYSRAWLDLQRSVVQACTALGPDYAPIGQAIASELRALILDLPDLPTAALTDDTPAANAETQVWLASLLENGVAVNGSFRQEPADGFARATAALGAGETRKAFAVMTEEVNRQTSGRGRFLRGLQLVELFVSAGKDGVAQPLLEDLIAQAEHHKIDEWEDSAIAAGALTLFMSASKRIQGDAKEKQKYFERICRLDPARAAGGS